MRPPRMVLFLFLIAQICDGLLTYVAVSAFGPAACGVLLYLKGIHRTLALLTLLYAVGAVGPWVLVLRGL